MAALRHTALVALSVAVAGTASAQGGNCEIKDGSPFQLSSAKQYLNQAETSKYENERPKHLRNAVRVLTDNGEKINNQLGRNFLLGRTFLVWMNQPNASLVMKRGAVGYTQNPNADVDILAAFDSAMTQVVTLAPACAARADTLRRYPFNTLFNAAVTAFTEDKLDSAEMLAKRSLSLMPTSVNAYNLLGNIASRRNDMPAALAAMREVIRLSAGDTTFAKVRQINMYNLAVLTTGQAERQEGEERKRSAQQAAELFRAYLKELPGEANGTQGLARSLQLSGDTASIASIYADMKANPERFTDNQLFEAATSAVNAKRDADAVVLYEAGLAKNPYHRDGLFNLANTYFAMKDYEKMMPVVERLLAVDPNYAQNWRLLAGAYQLRYAATKAKADQESLLANLKKSEVLLHNVTVNRFQHAGAAHTVEGSIENRGKAAASFAMTVEFVDKDGKVVASQDVQVGPVAPQASAAFTAKVEGTGIVAYRMTPIK